MLKQKAKPIIIAVVALAVLGGGYYFFAGRGEVGPSAGTTFKVAQGPLEISVIEGGSIQAAKSQQLKSEVQGETKILSIVEEGYLVTPQDVEKGLVLVELDSKQLLDQQTERELSYQRAFADFTQAREEYEIQRTENQSAISAAEMLAKFGRLDFEKYLGINAALEICKATDVENRVLSAPVQMESGGAGEAGELGENMVDDYSITMNLAADVDFSAYASSAALGDGEAQQKLRKAEDDYVLAQQELEAARSQVEGTKRLFEREFVTRLELEKDELALQRAEIKLASTETERDLYVRYEFPKLAEKLFSDYAEALRKLDRSRRSAYAKMAQAEAKLKASEAQYTLQKRKRDEIEEQLQKCVLKATQTGLVVYGDGSNEYWRDDDRIEEGTVVRERQVIITIPDTSVMTVEVKVHESKVKSIQLGQRARISIDAFPGIPLEGELTKIAVLPDSQNRWMNPDLKVYNSTIRIDGFYDWLKPGMTAEAEILVKKLDNAVYVPLQAVTPVEDGHVCYVQTLAGAQARNVKVGEFNNTFIEIVSGLDAGETVLLRAPTEPKTDDESGAPETKEEEKKEDGGGEETATESAA
jgi:HlyD family secretion protein